MKTLLYAICYLIYTLSFLFPRKENKWVFGSFKGAFNDNAKYLFIYVSEHCPGIKAMWISNNKETVAAIRSIGLRAYYTYSVQGVLHALTSKYWFFNAYTSDIMFCLSGKVNAVNLWHGVGLKKIEFNITSGPLAKRYVDKVFKERYFHPESFRRPDYFLSTTPFETIPFSSAFRIPVSRCMEFGYPRNEILTMSEAKRIEFVQKYEFRETHSIIQTIQYGYDKVYVYMPTWRDSQRDLFTQNFNLVRIDEIMRANNALMILKPHANTVAEESIFQQFKNILFVDSRIDIYPILPYTNVLITDYSSILYDYILMKGKDVILYLYDYEEYVKERDFFAPFDENVVGKKIYDFEALCSCVEQEDYKINEEERTRIIEKFWGESMNSDPCGKIVRKISSLT